MRVGQTWQPGQGDPRNLLLRPFDGSRDDLAALARVRNETLRPITAQQDFAEMSADDIDSFYNRPPAFVLLDNAWLMFHEDEPMAAAVVYPRAFFHDRPPGNFDLYVVPGLRRHGLGSRLLAHIEQAASHRGHRTLETTIATVDQSSTGFLLEHGFKVVGQSAHMVRTGLADISQATLPNGFSIRSLLDLDQSPDLYRETTNRLGAYDLNYSLLTPEEMDHMASTDSWDPAGVLFLLDQAGRFVGVIRAGRTNEGRGYLHEIRLEPSLRGAGLGSAILAAALGYLTNAGISRVELDTTGDNSPAHNLALKAGFNVIQHWHHFLKALAPVENIA